MKKILFYYHHFGGLGHGTRIFSICKAVKELCPDYGLLVINSGAPQSELGIERFARVVNLPYFIAKEGLFSGIRSTDDLNATFARREAILKAIASAFKPDIAIFEHFPFGRDSLAKEISGFIISLRQRGTLIYSSVRDIVSLSLPEKALNARLSLFDAVMIHSEQKLGFMTNFRISSLLQEKLFFTGRVFPLTKSQLNAQKKPAIFSKISKKKILVISIGGGIDGTEIINKLLDVKDDLDNKHKTFYLISVGPSYKGTLLTQLRKRVRGRKDIVIRRFFADYLRYIKHADLYVAMGGYNSVNNAIFAAKRNLIFPRLRDNEQLSRTKLFKQYINLGDRDWDSEVLVKKITQLLDKKPIKYSGSFSGAQISARFIERALNLSSLKLRITTKCNCHCDMCSWRESYAELSLDKIKEIIDQAKILNFRYINFTGGEPTLYPRFNDIVRYARERDLLVSLSTNGVINPKRLVSFIRNISFVDMSINSYDSALDGAIRGNHRALERSLTTLRNIRKLNPATKIHINVTVRPDNFNRISKIVSLLSGLADSISFTLVDARQKGDHRFIFNSKQLHAFYFKEVPLILGKAIKENIRASITPFFTEPNNLSREETLRRLTMKAEVYLRKFPAIFGSPFLNACPKEKTDLRINADGKISPCCYADDDNVALGNIHKEQLAYLLTSERYYDCISGKKKFKFCARLCQAGYRRYKRTVNKA